MKRILPTLILLAVVGGAWWWQRLEEVRTARAWQPLSGGGTARILTITHGTTHHYQEPPPGLAKRISDAIRARSMAPLRRPPPGGFSSSVSSGRSGLGVWLELRGARQSSTPQNAELILPNGHIFYAHGGSGGSGPRGNYHMTTIFDYIPVRAKTLRYACKLGGQRVEFEFDNPAYRTDLPVWKGTTLPQTRQSGGLALTLRALKLERATDYSNRTNPMWVARPAWSLTKEGEPANKWFGMSVVFEDPSGQSLRECGLFDEPVWKVVCSAYRTNNYPFRDDEVQWLGTVGPDAPPEQTTQLFNFDPNTQPGSVKLAGVFGPGEYWYHDGAIVETKAPGKIDATHLMIQSDYQTKKIRVTIDKPAVVIFGSAFFIYRDAQGRPTQLTEVWSHGGSSVGSVAIYALPKAPIRIGTASSTEPGIGKFEFFIPTPEKPGLKTNATKP